MILNFELDDETGARLDALAKRECRSRRQQATKLLQDALDMLEGDSLATEPAPAPTEAHHAAPTPANASPSHGPLG